MTSLFEIRNLVLEILYPMSIIYRSTNRYLNDRQNTIHNLARYGNLALACVAIFIVGFLIGLFTARLWNDGIAVIATITVVAAVLIIIGIRYWQKDWNIELLRFQAGVRAEEDTRSELERLPNDYTVFHNLNLPSKRGNIDFVVIGPTGLMALEVKGHKGTMSFSNGQILKNGRPFEKDIINQTYRSSDELQKIIADRLHVKISVLPMLVFAHRQTLVQPASFLLNRSRELLVTHLQFLNNNIKQCTGNIAEQDRVKIVQLLRSFIE